MTYKTVAVYEYLNNDIDWIPYCAEVCHQLERASKTNLTRLYLRDVDTNLSAYVVDITRSEQKNIFTGKARLIRRRLYSLFPGSRGYTVGLGICWQWLADQFGIWCSYPTKVQNLIEEAFKQNVPQIDLENISPKLPYIIDFETMSQTRKKIGTVRPIKRSTTRSYPYARKEAENESSDSDESSAVSITKACRSTPTVPEKTNLKTKKRASKKKSKNEQPSADADVSMPLTSYIGSKIMSWMKPTKVPMMPLTSENNLSGDDQTAGTSTQSETKVKRKPGNRAKSKRSIGAKPVTVKNYETSASNPSNVNAIFDECTSELQDPPAEDCIICCEELTTTSSYGEDACVVQFVKCEHKFHRSCLKAMIASGNVASYIQCPTCKVIYGKKFGNQPDGCMKYYSIPESLPSFSDCRTICILYEFSSGIQGPDHPEPGNSYSVSGFPRLCYLPDNEVGRKILQMLCVAWQRRLIFTIGTSITTGYKNVVTWNEIHHKTEFGSNFSGHGYPDTNYFDNVILELASHGVVENDPDVRNWQL